MVDMPPYLTYLLSRYEALGGTIERATLGSLDDALQRAPRVANCAGLGAAALVPDPEVVPSRGPKIVMENPGIDRVAIVGPPGPELTAFHPHGDIVVLGGSADTRAHPDEEAAIIERCAAIEPCLRAARVLEHRVGLRPDRPQVRLEVERRVGNRVVHNYGPRRPRRHALLGMRCRSGGSVADLTVTLTPPPMCLLETWGRLCGRLRSVVKRTFATSAPGSGLPGFAESCSWDAHRPSAVTDRATADTSTPQASSTCGSG